MSIQTCKCCSKSYTDSANCYDIFVTGYCGGCIDDVMAEDYLSRDADHPSIDEPPEPWTA